MRWNKTLNNQYQGCEETLIKILETRMENIYAKSEYVKELIKVFSHETSHVNILTE